MKIAIVLFHRIYLYLQDSVNYRLQGGAFKSAKCCHMGVQASNYTGLPFSMLSENPFQKVFSDIFDQWFPASIVVP